MNPLTPSPRDYPEDAQSDPDNGAYNHTCFTCKHPFVGHKHRPSICRVCQELQSPAMIGTSEGERKHIGLLEAVALRKALQQEFGIPVFLNADHSKSVDSAKAAIDAGYDSVHIDLSAESFEDNVNGTAEIIAYARSKSADINVEGELGYLRGESKVQKEKVEVRPEDLTRAEDARTFAERTGVDRFAPAVGNVHGIAIDEPALDIERIGNIRKALPEEGAIVLHAGSGVPEAQIKEAIGAGIANIHINTDIRVAFVGGLREAISANPEETTPYKLFPEAEEAMANVVSEKLKLFGAKNRI